MTKTDQLNMASDLRRAAYFVATNSNIKLTSLILDNIRKEKDIIQKINIDFSLKDEYLAEELLMASKILQSNLSS